MKIDFQTPIKVQIGLAAAQIVLGPFVLVNFIYVATTMYAATHQILWWILPVVFLIIGWRICSQGMRQMKQLWPHRHEKADADFLSPRSAEDRLDELERLKRRDMITPEEYAAKRQEILKNI